MALRGQLFRLLPQNIGSGRHFQTTTINSLNEKWRAAKGKSRNPTTESLLTTLPDFTYLDGRATPVGVRQRERMRLQQQYAEKIVEGISELEFAKQRLQRIQREEAEKRQTIIDGKFKPKGHLLNKEKS